MAIAIQLQHIALDALKHFGSGKQREKTSAIDRQQKPPHEIGYRWGWGDVRRVRLKYVP